MITIPAPQQQRHRPGDSDYIGLSPTRPPTSPDSTASPFRDSRITIDDSLADWAGVPVAATDDEGDASGYDLRELYVANDDRYLYLMVRIYPSSTITDYRQVHHQFFIDGDNDPSTGRADLGLGAEMVAWNYDVNGVGLLLSNYLSAGAVFHLNGAAVKRVRMPEGPWTTARPPPAARHSRERQSGSTFPREP